MSECEQAPAPSDLIDSEEVVRPSLIAHADREHHFGPIIATSGRKLEHRFRLNNPTQRDVKILKVINRKSCCGVVRGEATILHPGDRTEVVVTLLVGDRFGEVAHAAEVVTDSPEEPSLLLLTSAQAIPPVRIEEDSSFDQGLRIRNLGNLGQYTQ